jgi:ABC-type multidrug transport system fused ATPase/permease subunit
MENKSTLKHEIETNKSTLISWFMRQYVKPYSGVLFFALIFMTVEGSMMGLLSYSVKMLFDNVFMSGSNDDTLFVGFLIFSIFSLRALSGFVQRLLLSSTGQKISKQVQYNIVIHMLNLSNDFFYKNAPGLLIERVRGDTQKIVEMLSLVLMTIGRDGVAFVSLIMVAVIIDWTWALLAFVGAPLLIIPILILQKWIRVTAMKSRNADGENTTQLDEIFHGINAIKLNNAEVFESKRFEKVLEVTRKIKFRMESGMAGMPAIIDLVAAFGFFAVMVFGGREIISGQKTVGEFMSFFTAMALIFEPLRRLSNVAGCSQVALASLDKLYCIFSENSTIAQIEAPTPITQISSKLNISFENVSFYYGKKSILSNISFKCDPGKLIAIVGASGAGKTTILNLIPRLIDPSTGNIFIGGIDTKMLGLKDLRNLISVVSQESSLFDNTIRSNIIMGSKLKSDSELNEVLTDSFVEEFLPNLPDGLDTHVGPRGANISGGQRQRILIARALFRDKPILILDEPTSSLDSKSEKVIESALDKLAYGRTTIVVAHRLSTIMNADRILVLKSGVIVEVGSHKELLSNGSYYRELVNSQLFEKNN